MSNLLLNEKIPLFTEFATNFLPKICCIKTRVISTPFCGSVGRSENIRLKYYYLIYIYAKYKILIFSNRIIKNREKF